MKADCILHTPFDHNLSPTLDRPLGKPSLPQQWTWHLAGPQSLEDRKEAKLSGGGEIAHCVHCAGEHLGLLPPSPGAQIGASPCEAHHLEATPNCQGAQWGWGRRYSKHSG